MTESCYVLKTLEWMGIGTNCLVLLKWKWYLYHLFMMYKFIESVNFIIVIFVIGRNVLLNSSTFNLVWQWSTSRHFIGTDIVLIEICSATDMCTRSLLNCVSLCPSTRQLNNKKEEGMEFVPYYLVCCGWGF